MDMKDLPQLEVPEAPAKRKRGRPKSPNSMSNAERQKKWRNQHKPVNFGPRMGATIEFLAKEFEVPVPMVIRALCRFALCNRDWKKLGIPSGYVWEREIKE
jgi:hypothetical protein